MRRRRSATSLYEMLNASKRAGDEPSAEAPHGEPLPRSTVEAAPDAVHARGRTRAQDLIPNRRTPQAAPEPAARSVAAPWAASAAATATVAEGRTTPGSPRGQSGTGGAAGSASGGGSASAWSQRLPELPGMLSSWGSGGGEAGDSFWSWLNHPEPVRRITMMVLAACGVLLCALAFQAGKWAFHDGEAEALRGPEIHPPPRGSVLPEDAGKQPLRNVEQSGEEPEAGSAKDAGRTAATNATTSTDESYFTVLVATTKVQEGAQSLLKYLDKHPELGWKAECRETRSPRNEILLEVVIGQFERAEDAETLRKRIRKLPRFEKTDFGNAVVREVTGSR